MTTAPSAELNEIVDRVRGWDPDSRAMLVRRILDTLEPPEVSDPPRRIPLEKVFGFLKTENPPPTDEEVRTIIEEERTRKYL